MRQAKESVLDEKGRTVWRPCPGSQTLFLTCPFFECLYDGTRGPGKSISLLMDFAQHVGQGFHSDWRGILFRRSYKELADLVVTAKRLYKSIFPQARWLDSTAAYKWVWPTGEELLFRVGVNEADYWQYHGHQYPWIGYDELCSWPDMSFYNAMRSCCRSSNPSVPRKIRAATNPWGPAHVYVKAYFVSPAPAGTPITEEGGRTRVRISGSIWENRHLLDADPDYIKTLLSEPDPNKRKAWVEGSWDIVAGSVFDDCWSDDNVVDPFTIPKTWRIDRSFDWGSSAPFAVLWWAESNGETVEISGIRRTFPAGTLVAFAEWYGCSGKPNEGLRMTASEIARGIVDREMAMRIASRVKPGPADSSIYAVANGNCIADDMARCGVVWTEGNRGPGSRINGVEIGRRMLRAVQQQPMEEPGLLFTSACRHSIRTIPVLPRDERCLDDVDTMAEDHIWDAVRYRILALSNRYCSYAGELVM